MKKKLFMMKTITVFIYYVDAKLRRFWADSKKSSKLFFNLCGQTPHLWPNRGKRQKSCPEICFFDIYSYLCNRYYEAPITGL